MHSQVAGNAGGPHVVGDMPPHVCFGQAEATDFFGDAVACMVTRDNPPGSRWTGKRFVRRGEGSCHRADIKVFYGGDQLCLTQTSGIKAVMFALTF